MKMLPTLIKYETEKLLKSPVSIIAPAVICLYLVLMLFGYEVYAAKNGVTKTEGMAGNKKYEQMTDSVIVWFFNDIHHARKNLTDMLTEKNQSIKQTGDGSSDENQGLGEFNYWETFFESLVNPKPLPKPVKEDPSDCSNLDNSKKDGVETFSFLNLFIGNAWAGETNGGRAPPPIIDSDSFVERLQKRVVWVLEPIDLEEKLIDRSRFNGMRFTYFSLYFGVIFLFPIIAVSVTAYMFAGEFSQGTVKNCLLLPLTRSKYLISKVLALGLYFNLLILLFLVAALALGITFTGYGNLVIDSSLLGNVESARQIHADGAFMLLIMSIPIIAISLFPLAAVSVLISYYKPEPATTIGASLGVYFILFSLGELPLFDEIKYLFFTTYMDSWNHLFESPFPAGLFLGKILIVGFISTGLLLLVDYISAKKDILV